MSYHPSKDFSDLYLSLLEQYRNLAFGRAVQYFFCYHYTYLLQSTLFFAGFTSFMGFIGTMQHLSWFTFVMRFLHVMKNPNSIFFYIYQIWLTIIDVFSTLEKNEYLISNSWYTQKDFSYSPFFRNNILQVYSIISFVRGCVYNIYTN